MTWVLDTCVLLDLVCNDKIFADCASRAIQSKLDDTPTIAPITYVENFQSSRGRCGRAITAVGEVAAGLPITVLGRVNDED